MKYIVKCEHILIVEANSKEEAESAAFDYESLYEEESIKSIERLSDDSIYNDYIGGNENV